MSVQTYTTKRGVTFNYDDELEQIELVLSSDKRIYTDETASINGDDFIEFIIHLTMNSQSFRRKYSLQIMKEDDLSEETVSGFREHISMCE